MDDKHLSEKRLESEPVFKGRLLDIYRDLVELPDGTTSTREYTIHPGAVALVPILPDGNILLIRQFRYAAGKVMVEIPAGKLDPGEDYIATAPRELLEETGYLSDKFTLLGEIDPCVGYSDEHMWICLAEDLSLGENNLDHDEFIELLPKSLDEALEMTFDGRITDVKTIIGIQWAAKYLKNPGKI